MQTPVRRHIRRQDDHSFLERDQTDQVQKECLAGAVLADDEANRRTSLSDSLDVANQLLDLPGATDLDVLQSQPGHHSRPKCLNDCVALAPFDSWCLHRWFPSV